MRAMGIDPSTRTGIAIVEGDKSIIHTEEIEFKKCIGLERASKIIGRIKEIHDTYKPTIITIEDMFVGHTSSAIPLIQLGSLIRYNFWLEDITYYDVSPMTLKKFVTGKGTSKKDEIMMYVLKRWGHASATNNIADAIGLAMIGLAYGGVPFSKEQEAALQKTKPATLCN